MVPSYRGPEQSHVRGWWMLGLACWLEENVWGRAERGVNAPPPSYLVPVEPLQCMWAVAGSVWTWRAAKDVEKRTHTTLYYLKHWTSARLLQDESDVWRLPPPKRRPAFNRLPPLGDQTPARFHSCSQAFNKQRKWHVTPSLSLKCCIARGRKDPLQLFHKYKFIWSTDKEKWSPFFLPWTPYDSNLGVLCILAQACGLW